MYVDRIVKATAPKQIEFTKLNESSSQPSGDEALTPEKRVAQEQRHRIARRAAKEIKDGFHVNLGIGMPTLVPEVCPADRQVFIASTFIGSDLRHRLSSWSQVCGYGCKVRMGSWGWDHTQPLNRLMRESWSRLNKFCLDRTFHRYLQRHHQCR